jgi:hypothetical protein
MRDLSWCVLILAATVGGCVSSIIPIVPDGPPTSSRAAGDPTFEVIARVAGAHDPLSVTGGDAEYSDLETALGQAVSRAVPPRHDNILTVELIHADAKYVNTRLSVSMVARATLRTRVGDTFVAQKDVVCRDGAIIAPREGAKVIWSCMTRLGQDLGGWLEGLPP